MFFICAQDQDFPEVEVEERHGARYRRNRGSEGRDGRDGRGEGAGERGSGGKVAGGVDGKSGIPFEG